MLQIETYTLSSKTLDFKFEAGTSRGTLLQHAVYYLTLNYKETKGIGEIAALPKLSIDYGVDFEAILQKIIWSKIDFTSHQSVLQSIQTLELSKYPSLVFGIETACLDLFYGGKKQIFENDFYCHSAQIPINGLIWMNTKAHMLQQIDEKLAQGFTCIKMKIGAINWAEELSILKRIREKHSADTLCLRVDANGSFDFEKAQKVLVELEKLDIHSIEQPIRVGQHTDMNTLCRQSKVGIALDEELIGIHLKEEKIKLLEAIKPQYIILKPTLHGGLFSCIEWMEIAKSLNIDFWITSALESNIGLNAICQFTDFHQIKGYQGLGTGSLYHNNIDSPLTVEKGFIYYDKNKTWY